MPSYIPFLKFKQNEIQALGELDLKIRKNIRPFFDIPRTSKNQSEKEIHERLDLGIKNLNKLILGKKSFEFYVDNFDLDDDIQLNGMPQYEYILSQFIGFRAIPVFALDRNNDHNFSAFEYLKEVRGKVAVRLQVEDIDSYAITRKKLIPLWRKFHEMSAQEIHLVVDTRVIRETTIETTADKIIAFLNKFVSEFSCEKIITTGSTIPAIIGTLIETDESINIPRREFLLWQQIIDVPILKNVLFGDYGVVSPDYADIDLDPRLFRRISTPKAFYPYDNMLFAVRGISFQAHPTGNGQYFLIADEIQKQLFFRDKPYSFGDSYIFERSKKSAKKPTKAGSAGSWVKATLTSHITYVSNQV